MKKNDKYSALSELDIRAIEILEETNKKLHFLYRQFFKTLLFSLIVWIIFGIVYFVTEKSFTVMVITITLVVLSLIFLMFSSFLSIVRLWWDRKVLISKLYERFSNNYIIGNWWDNSKRIKKQLCLIDKDNKILYDGGLYDVQYNCVWLDDRKRPNSFYYKNNSVPLQINPNSVVETDARGLKSFRDTTFTNEIIEGNIGNPLNFKIVLIIVGVLVVLGIIFIIISSSTGNPILLRNSTIIK